MARQRVVLDADDITSLTFIRGRGSMQAMEVKRIAREKGVSDQQVVDAFGSLSDLERGFNFTLSIPFFPIILIRQRLAGLFRRGS